MTHHRITFPGTRYAPVDVLEDRPLPYALDAGNSPVLFGCRTGICGTCLCEAEGDVPPPDEDEQHTLDIFAPDNAKARLACQIKLRGPLALRALAW